jgi:hypothetical protein
MRLKNLKALKIIISRKNSYAKLPIFGKLR